MNITPINDLPIEDVISRYIKLTKRGNSLSAKCPFHTEKTSSFKVSPQKNVFNCFGCGKKGDSISFVMQHAGVSFIDACKKIATDHNLKIELTPQTPEQKQLIDKKESLMAIMEIATKWFQEQLFAKGNEDALKYALSRWTKEQIEEHRIGFAPDGWHNFIDYATKQKINHELLIDADLCAIGKDRANVYDVYRNRIMFPIFDRYGRVISYSGRILPNGAKDQPKYINGKDTILYSKGKTLYGLNFAARSIREKSFVFLVEGNPDVIKLHKIQKLNTIAACGTALTDDQIQIIKSLCNSVTLIGDGDIAGLKATIKNGEKLINAGLFCNVIELPLDKEKSDPDSFFTDEEQFNDHAADYVDYIIWRAVKERDKCKTPDYKFRVIKELTPLIAKLDVSCHLLLIDELGEIIKPKKAWADELKLYQKDEKAIDLDNFIPKNVDLKDFKEFGFYEENNQYFFDIGKGFPVRRSNFKMVPKFHISSVINAKRIYTITNVYGFSLVIELSQKDITNLSGFRLRVESLGNFLWEGTDIEFNRLKRFLYAKTQTAYEITQLGWQADGFYAWSNGAFIHQENCFSQVDENGIVDVAAKSYYLPAFSKIYENEQSLYVSERHFRHQPGKVTMQSFSSKMMEVFGSKSIFCIAFVIATLFRDHIHRKFGFFPILNLFGQKGAGKTEAAITLLQFFGPQSKGPNMTNTSKAALADHVSQVSNACSHIDEYKNSVEYEKIEFLKGLWDGTGRTRMNMDKDKKKETTNVDAGIILSGQEMPTADIALFSRLVFITFSQTEYTDEEATRFMEFDEMRKSGLTHITCDYLQHRDYFLENFIPAYKEVQKDFNDAVTAKIEDRIKNNWIVLVASYKVMQNKIPLAVSYDQLLKMAITNIISQNNECGHGNEMGIFWRIFEFLANDGQLLDGYDYHVKWMTTIKTDKLENCEWKNPKKVLVMRHSRVYELYRTHGKQSQENILPIKSLDFYVKTHSSYLGKASAVAFKVKNEDSQSTGVKRQITTAYCFDYDRLEISVDNTRTAKTNMIDGEVDEYTVEQMEKVSGNELVQDINALTPQATKMDLPY